MKTADNDEKRMWGIHTQDDMLFLGGNVIAIGWEDLGDLRKIGNTREAIKVRCEAAYPNWKKRAIANSAGMLYRFVYEAQIGDYVIFPSKSNRQINLGIIEGEYTYEPSAQNYVQQRRVKWIKHLPRTAFSQGALYEIGSALTFFAVKSYAEEFMAALDSDFPKHGFAPEDESVGATADEIIESTKDFILKELSKHLKGYALEEFIANLLGAMGYRTHLSPQGGDSGIDITAYKDELPPRILVQVKSQDGDIRETTIQSLKGAMHEGDYGLFVTLSDFTKKAQNYLENTPIIKSINGIELVDLILKYYEQLDEKYQRIIPLKMVYIPVARPEE